MFGSGGIGGAKGKQRWACQSLSVLQDLLVNLKDPIISSGRGNKDVRELLLRELPLPGDLLAHQDVVGEGHRKTVPDGQLVDESLVKLVNIMSTN